MLDLEDLIFRTLVLAQSHPFTPRAYRYFNEIVAQQQANQSTAQVGTWAGYAITAGYCLRKVEESDTGSAPQSDGSELPRDLDEASTLIATRIRTDGAGPYLLYPEERLVAALDALIASEVKRRLWPLMEEGMDKSPLGQLEEYLAWWVIKGYALRVVDALLPEEVGAEPGPDSASR